MTALPRRCVVDTNVATTANGRNPAAGPACIAESARALHALVREGHVFVDDGGLILHEYRQNLNARGQPGAGDLFLEWLMTHEYNPARCTRVRITPSAADPEDFAELPAPADGTVYDRSDRKFLAVSAAHPDHPPVLQSFDSKWWGWQKALAALGVRIHFLCPAEIEAKYEEKMGP